MPPSTNTSDTEKKLEQQLELKLLDIEVRKLEDNTRALAAKLGLPYVNLKLVSVNPSALILLDEDSALAGQMAVLSKSGNKLRIAVVDPENPKTKEILTQLTVSGHTWVLAITSILSLQEVWKEYKIEKRAKKTELGIESIKESEILQLKQEIKDITHLKERLFKMPVTEALNVLVAGGLAIDASDIHLEPEKDVIRLRYRMDGLLQDIVDIGKTDYPHILNRIKIMSGLKINVHTTPQDGRFTFKEGDTEIEMRTSILPGAYGENIVMRLLDPRRIKQKLEDLGMRPDTLQTIKDLLKKTTGAIITTGPTGSGKTTTLYAFINQINSPDVKIITIENPIEYHIKGISQTQVDPHAGYTFASGLRSIVRQDPDVILVGEIRDAETAEIAMQAALTGHLVFSTLHTNDAAGAIPRLIDLDVNPITIAPATNATMAQRLIRRLCQACKQKRKVSDENFAVIAKYMKNLPAELNAPEISKSMEIYYPQKCKECNLTGYKDRIGVFEIIVMDPELEKLIITSPSITAVKELCTKKGFVTMLQDGLLRALQGVTSVEEVVRVIGE